MDWLHWRMKEESVPQSDDLFTFVQFCCSFPSFNKCGIQLHFCETVFCFHPFVAQQSKSTAFIISHLWFIFLRVIFIIYVTYKSDVSFILISFTNDRLKGVCQLLASSLNLLATICLFYKRICRFDGSFPLSTMLFNNLHCSLVVMLLLLSKINSFLLKFVGFFACFFPLWMCETENYINDMFAFPVISVSTYQVVNINKRTKKWNKLWWLQITCSSNIKKKWSNWRPFETGAQ